MRLFFEQSAYLIYLFLERVKSVAQSTWYLFVVAEKNVLQRELFSCLLSFRVLCNIDIESCRGT